MQSYGILVHADNVVSDHPACNGAEQSRPSGGHTRDERSLMTAGVQT